MAAHSHVREGHEGMWLESVLMGRGRERDTAHFRTESSVTEDSLKPLSPRRWRTEREKFPTAVCARWWQERGWRTSASPLPWRGWGAAAEAHQARDPNWSRRLFPIMPDSGAALPSAWCSRPQTLQLLWLNRTVGEQAWLFFLTLVRPEQAFHNDGWPLGWASHQSGMPVRSSRSWQCDQHRSSQRDRGWGLSRTDREYVRTIGKLVATEWLRLQVAARKESGTAGRQSVSQCSSEGTGEEF